MRAVDAACPGSVGFCKYSGAMVQTAAAPNLKSFLMQRLRWASKGSMQGMAVRLFRGALVLWYAALLTSLPLLLYGEVRMSAFILGAWILKLCGEWFYFRCITPFFGIRVRFAEIASFQGVQTSYPIVIALAGLFRLRFRWKGRTYG